ncbi:hypothetical protein BDV35DRAFT_396417 [Aspergillus flavus]|uniref:Uncharacterized protein n=2 Tax=Aspergillus subgen. Circumdati TaxID=2720871 RepID=A0A1S9DTL2_ASPOZ|nr:uncharacterized protein G4B84_007357 [Aspergillus flavus NRRL3357]KAB8242787.1 hypothetical protein BDV35DRAFT_396417 [Aspergillus flavus]OOO12216.1 hypothetical protein OAory_01086860 [Aspergillus oryzae]KAF7621099.1 hypothetical protein AFLA_011413 [Aspergillus flavus NRRL3357]KAJ1708824.1 hypothetical protein NYO67_9002 [Aspergillus flavus]QMW31976.1 hypothetical protein G4B84_007357 [Aspergillus flavus NRRL3357]
MDNIHVPSPDTQCDLRIYVSGLAKRLATQSSETDAFIIGDIVTSPGCVPVNLANDAVRNYLSLADMKSIALDTNPTIIDMHYKAVLANSASPSLSWEVLGVQQGQVSQ